MDPSLKTYQILGFKRSIGSLIGLKSFKEAFKSTMSGHFFKGIQGDSLQEGGVIIISTNNKIYYFYQSKEAGDHPLVSNMIKALKSSQEAI